MKKTVVLIAGITILVMVLGACSPKIDLDTQISVVEEMEKAREETQSASEESGEEGSDDMVGSDTETSADAMVSSELADLPAWYDVSLTDAQTGAIFTINELRSKNVVLVETMAQWCSNCYKQQEQVKALHDLLPEAAFVSVGLDIDPNEDLPSLKDYISKNNFDWYYAISPVEVSREIGELYGEQFLNPPSTPIVLVDTHGVAHPLPFGIKSAEELAEFITLYLPEEAVSPSDADETAQNWVHIPLTNALTGETFTVAEVGKGNLVLIEPMTQWCAYCLKQQLEIKALYADLGTDAFVTISLDIEPFSEEAMLLDYVEQGGFSWLYAKAPVEVTRQIGESYGEQYLNTTSAPLILIDQEGYPHPLPAGVKSVEELKGFLAPYLPAAAE